MIEQKWLANMMSKYYTGISNFFILTGNINDYPVPSFLFNDYLVENLLATGFDIVHKINLIDDDAIDNLCNHITSKDKKNAVIITHPEFLFPNIPAEQMQRGVAKDFVKFYEIINSKEFINSDNMVILLSESKYSINPKLLAANTRSYLIEVDFPQEDERLVFLEYLKETSKIKVEHEVSLKEFATLTAGLTLVGIEDIYLQGESTGKLRREFVIQRKQELIRKEYGEVIEVLDSDGFDFSDFAGQDHLKEYHREVIINPMMTGEVDIVPKGLLYTGPPGTGKTHFARCLSGEAGINFVELKMSKILDKWVGESEKRFDKALTCIKSIAPVGVFIDEIDQAFSRGENESNSVGRNLFGMFLTVLSDPANRGKIIWIGAANYPNKIDEALKRTGRFDKKMPFLPPNKEDRIRTMKVHLNKSKFKNNINENEFIKLSELTDGYTQAEIEGIVTKTLEIIIRQRKNKITFEDIIYASELIVTAKSDKIDEMVRISIDECNDLEFLPKEYRKS